MFFFGSSSSSFPVCSEKFNLRVGRNALQGDFDIVSEKLLEIVAEFIKTLRDRQKAF